MKSPAKFAPSQTHSGSSVNGMEKLGRAPLQPGTKVDVGGTNPSKGGFAEPGIPAAKKSASGRPGQF